MTDGYAPPTVAQLLPLIEQCRPGMLTADQKTQVANKAIEIFSAYIKFKRMYPMIAVKLALVKFGF